MLKETEHWLTQIRVLLSCFLFPQYQICNILISFYFCQPGGLESLFDRRCRILANQTVTCDLDIYQNPSEWAVHKEKIDAMIREYRKALDDLRVRH